jgi:hypothetical protein
MAREHYRVERDDRRVHPNSTAFKQHVAFREMKCFPARLVAGERDELP